jgi:hypothetical protein
MVRVDTMGGACSMYGESRGVYMFWLGNLMERDHLKDPGIDGRKIVS